MAHRTTFFHRHKAALPVVAAALLGLAACVSEMPDPGPLSDIGVVEGRITEAGLPVPAKIRFRSDNYDADVTAVANADSSGWYRVELPLGLYYASLSMNRDWIYTDSMDTVSVGRAVRRRDFPRGRARVTVALPSVFDGGGVSLRLQNESNRCELYCDMIDSTATFDFRLTAPRAYTMRLYTGNDRSDVLLPGTYDAELADSLRVGTNDVSHFADMRPALISITGHVNGSWQLGNNTMRVRAIMPFGALRSQVACEPDGSFRIHLLAPERIRFQSRCGEIEQWFGGDSFQTATAYDLQAGDRVSGLDLTEGGLRIRTEGIGTIADRSAHLYLHDADGNVRSFRVENRQPHLVSNLAAGSYRLQVIGFCAGDPWLSQWYQGAGTEAEAAQLEVVSGAFTDATITLQTGGALAGTLVEADGDIGHVGSIYVHDQDGVAICGGAGFHGGGHFEVAGLADGDYYLRIMNLGGNWWYPGTNDFSLATRLTIANADTVANLVWTVPETDDWVYP